MGMRIVGGLVRGDATLVGGIGKVRPFHFARTGIVSPRRVALLRTLLALAVWPLAANAEPGIQTTWQSTYALSSSDTNAGCNLCHGGTTSKWNPYGWNIRVGINVGGKTVTQAILDAEASNSDSDPGGFTNLQEINANTQPGWTTGAVNTI